MAVSASAGAPRGARGIAGAHAATPGFLRGALCLKAWLALDGWSASPYGRHLDHGG